MFILPLDNFSCMDSVTLRITTQWGELLVQVLGNGRSPQMSYILLEDLGQNTTVV